MSASDLTTELQDAMREAMRARDQRRVNCLRLIIAAVKQFQIDQRAVSTDPVSDAQLIPVLDKMVKQRRDAIEQFQKANRQELAEQEAYEITVIEAFLPTPLTSEELKQLIEQAMAATRASGAQDMGKVMAHLKPLVQGRTDMKALSQQIKEKLAVIPRN
jgi:uncharacterized protein YqeY